MKENKPREFWIDTMNNCYAGCAPFGHHYHMVHVVAVDDIRPLYEALETLKSFKDDWRLKPAQEEIVDVALNQFKHIFEEGK